MFYTEFDEIFFDDLDEVDFDDLDEVDFDDPDEVDFDDLDEVDFDDPDEMGQCVVCRDKFPLDELNGRGECEEHIGETLYSDEEKEAWASLIENINKY